MRKATTYYIGLMTGTSLDAVEVALLEFDVGADGLETGQPRINAHHQAVYPDSLRSAVLALNQGQAFTMQQYGYVDVEVARVCADAVEALLKKTDVHSNRITAIGLHGQTVHHQPGGAKNYGIRFTLQLGDPHIVAVRLGIPVVADFRRRDMALGGQGAPLACGFHDKVFRAASELRIVLNLGGIANITVLAPGREVFGYDTGPANILLDYWVQKYLKQAYDADGAWAQGGQILPRLLENMLADSYFILPAPKSTGRERFNEAWLEAHLNAFAKQEGVALGSLNPQSVQATLLELTAQSVAAQVQSCAKECALSANIIVCGGGAYNGFLLHRIQTLCANARLQTTADFGIFPEAIEAAAFAFFAQQTWRGIHGNIPSVTGASRPCLLGNIVYP